MKLMVTGSSHATSLSPQVSPLGLLACKLVLATCATWKLSFLLYLFIILNIKDVLHIGQFCVQANIHYFFYLQHVKEKVILKVSLTSFILTFLIAPSPYALDMTNQLLCSFYSSCIPTVGSGFVSHTCSHDFSWEKAFR